MKSVKAWAICDTNGGRSDPLPLIKWIYETEHVALQERQIKGLDPAYYPVLPVMVEER